MLGSVSAAQITDKPRRFVTLLYSLDRAIKNLKPATKKPSHTPATSHNKKLPRSHCVSLQFQDDRDKIANLIEEALRSCFSNQQILSPGLVSLTSLPNQTTLLLPGPEYPRLQRLEDVKQASALKAAALEPAVDTRQQQQRLHEQQPDSTQAEPQAMLSEAGS